MTLATRCTACGTSFRVVQDQLKVSGGWVRCGRCNEVFNALEGLYEIFTQPPEPDADEVPPGDQPVDTGNTDAPASPASPASSAAPGDSAGPTGELPGEAAPDSAQPASQGDADESEGAGEGEPPPSPSPAASLPSDAEVHASPTSALEVATTRPAAPTEPAPWDERPAPGFDDVETRLEPRAGDEIGPMPSFMQHAAKGRDSLSRGERLTWTGAAALLAILLGVQLAVASRDSLAARLPGLRPLLAAACVPFGCSIAPPRNMAALTVEGSNLRQRAGDGFYELIVAVRNRSAAAVLVPAFELTLTDSQGRALIRRVLSATDMGATDIQMPAGDEWSLRAVLEVGDRSIAGYTVEIFYP